LHTTYGVRCKDFNKNSPLSSTYEWIHLPFILLFHKLLNDIHSIKSINHSFIHSFIHSCAWFYFITFQAQALGWCKSILDKGLRRGGMGVLWFSKNTFVKEKEVNNMRTLDIFAKSGKQRAKSWVTLIRRMTIKMYIGQRQSNKTKEQIERRMIWVSLHSCVVPTSTCLPKNLIILLDT
jgi:hypothetical protein